MIRGSIRFAFLLTFAILAFVAGVGLEFGVRVTKAPGQVDLAEKFYSASERALWERFVAEPPPAFDDSVDPNFAMRLRAAVGFDTPTDLTIRDFAYEHPVKNNIREVRFGFAAPSVTLRALYWKHSGAQSENLVVMMHGFASTADKVLGFDKPDYMQFAGGHIYNAGHDIIAFDMPSDPVIASAMNTQLMWHGTTVEGLWSRAVCEAISHFGAMPQYERIVLYGVRESGRIADAVSVLCRPVSLVVIDGGVLDRRRAIWLDSQRQQMKQPILFDQLVPIEGSVSISNFLAHSRSPKVYVNTREEIAAISDALRGRYQRQAIDGSRLSFVYKRRARSVPELPIVHHLVRYGSADLDGFGVTRTAR